MSKYIGCILFLLCGTQIQTKAQDKIATDRPDQTEIATLTPLHYFQAELGFSHERIQGEDYDNIYPNFLLKFGLTKFLELRLQNEVISQYRQFIPNTKITTGLKPFEPGFKLALFKGKNIIPKTSLIAHVGIPFFASKAFVADHFAPRAFFAMENDITKKINLGYNFGAEWDGFSSAPSWLYTISCGFEIGEQWESYLEFFGNATNNNGPENNFDGGICYYVNNDFKLDASAGFGISKEAPSYYLALGFSFRVK